MTPSASSARNARIGSPSKPSRVTGIVLEDEDVLAAADLQDLPGRRAAESVTPAGLWKFGIV